jgi:hypothetical protein
VCEETIDRCHGLLLLGLEWVAHSPGVFIILCALLYVASGKCELDKESEEAYRIIRASDQGTERDDDRTGPRSLGWRGPDNSDPGALGPSP